MKAKAAILSIALSLFVISGLFAQEKYEFGRLYTVGTTTVFVTATGTESFKATNPKEWESELTKKLNELVEKGWEVYSTGELPGGPSYYLRKKKN